MCGRSTLSKSISAIEKRYDATFFDEELELYSPVPNYNIAPTHMCPVITGDEPDKIHLFRWGLIPFWAKDVKIGYKMINARSETLLEKPSFKKAAESRRCIIPLDGFYEWKRDGKTKTPYRITTTNVDIFSVAGIWEKWIDKNKNEAIYSFTLITQPPNSMMENIHDRMPAILLPDQEKIWLDSTLSAAEVMKIIEPYPSEMMKAYKVSPKVGNVRNNSPDLILPLPDLEDS